MSKRKKTDLQSLDFYHASRSDHMIEDFHPFSHFGTKQAALSRACGVTFEGIGDFCLYTVRLKMENPLLVKDYSYGNHSWLRLADTLHYTKKIISAEERDRVFSAGSISSDEAFQKIKALLIQKGFDGLFYKNWHEDSGSLSYVILSTEQVEMICAESLSREETQRMLNISTPRHE